MPLALKLSARTVMADLQTVRAVKGLDAESIVAMVDNAFHPERLRFVFDVGCGAKGAARELRFWATEIIAPEFTAKFKIDEAVASILGARETFRRSEIEMQWIVSAQHISNLIKSGALVEEGNRLLSTSLKNFLRRRWISAASTLQRFNPSTNP